MAFTPRPKQQEVLEYTGGYMGVSAVPGAGKTMTLSALAAKILTELPLDDQQEVLIVTLVGSAVGNFSRQIRNLIKPLGMITGYGYRVRTLHGLANDIVRERPDLVGLDTNFDIVDEREADQVLTAAVDAWLRGNNNAIVGYILEDEWEKPKIRQQHMPNLLKSTANGFIRTAKDNTLNPFEVRQQLDAFDYPLPLAEACADIYTRYQQSLSYRGAVDFQDLIRLALKALYQDADYRHRLSQRWRYILEDEAQDSDQLQETILRELSSVHNNWVRVGDPNQAIYETFTTAHPRYLREFLNMPQVVSRELPNSGRCQPSIIGLANRLIDWSTQSHPNPQVAALEPLTTPYIEPTPLGDPQPNPPDNPDQVWLHKEGLGPAEEIDMVVSSVKRWLRENPDKTAAILSPRNKRGNDVVDKLRKAGVDYVELLQSTAGTREVAGSIYRIMAWLAAPLSPKLLAAVYEVYRRDDKNNHAFSTQIRGVAQILKDCGSVEAYLHPHHDTWLDDVAQDDASLRDELNSFREWIWLLEGAALLPIDQLVLTIANSLFHDEVDLSVAYSLSLQLRRDGTVQEQRGTWGLMQYAERLREIAKNERKFLGISEDDTAFNPDAHRGKVTVSTMHRAKGLEWDRVYLISVSNYDFPSGELHDSFMGDKWFIRDSLNIEAEARAQLKAAISGEVYIEGDASRTARLEYVAERLRLLYVGITRARQDLIITWNTGRNGTSREATPLLGLRTYWEQQKE